MRNVKDENNKSKRITFEDILWCLVHSDWEIKGDYNNCPMMRGFYLVFCELDIDEVYLKVGIATYGVNKDGLQRRIKQHFTSNYDSSVLARHLNSDQTIMAMIGLDLTNQQNRAKFVKDHCYFKILPTPFLRDDELEPIETKIENELRNQLRYIDNVKER